MDHPNPLRQAAKIVGTKALAQALGISPQAMSKWDANGRMPRTEWTGETSYAETIERLTGGQVSKAQLLGSWPVVTPPPQSPLTTAAALAAEMPEARDA